MGEFYTKLWKSTYKQALTRARHDTYLENPSTGEAETQGSLGLVGRRVLLNWGASEVRNPIAKTKVKGQARWLSGET